jgi:hypothetical protein
LDVAAPIVYICSSPGDTGWKDRLVNHLTPFNGRRTFTVWEDGLIGAGTDRQQAIRRALDEASAAVLLISAEFLASETLQRRVECLIQKSEEEGLGIVPVLVSPCSWKAVPWLRRMQILPRSGRPLANARRGDAESELAAIAGEILGMLGGDDSPDDPSDFSSDPDAPADAPKTGGPVVEVGTTSVPVEVTINQDLDSFTEEQLRELLFAIKDIVNVTGEIKVIAKRRGSVKLIIELSPEQAERLVWAAKADQLARWGVTDARLLEHSSAPAEPHSQEPQTTLKVRRPPQPRIGSPGAPWGAALRALALRWLAILYQIGIVIGSAALFVCGGWVMLWRRHGTYSRVEASEAPGVYLVSKTLDPDRDLGPVLARVDAPDLFDMIDQIGRRLGVRRPDQVRLTFLPCCGIVAWGRSRALIIGLPLFQVLTQGELRAIIARELAPLTSWSAASAVRGIRFVDRIHRALERDDGGRGLLGAWARFCYRVASRLIGPVAWHHEYRGDRVSEAIAGGGTASSALVKLAVVQPVFRELLEACDPNEVGELNLYALFRNLWFRLPTEVHVAMRSSILTRSYHDADPAHPPLSERVSKFWTYRDPGNRHGDAHQATDLLPALENFEQMLLDRLYGHELSGATISSRASERV